MKKVILASSSPRRQELFKKLHVPFVIDPGNFVEDMTLKLSPEELVKRLSLGKARDVAPRHPDSLIVGADTLIAFQGNVLGKPHTPTRAFEMLSLLNSKEHTVLTGYAVIDTGTGVIETHAAAATVFFKTISDSAIRQYIETGEPLERAGGYAIQEKGAFLIDRYVGDYDTIVGLPVKELAETLIRFGINPTYDK